MNLSQLHWLGHASFCIEDKHGILYIDPWKLGNDSPKADVIFVTHPHYDHFDLSDIAKIEKISTVIVGVDKVAKEAGRPVRVVEPGRKYRIESWDVETVPAYNVGKQFHPKQERWVGYVITLSDGTRLYHTGDTDEIDEIKKVRADILLVPCGGTYTMNADEAGRVANAIKPGTVIPMHWGDIVGSREDAVRVRELCDRTVILEPPKRTPDSR